MLYRFSVLQMLRKVFKFCLCFRVVNTKGPTNTREYEVAVYFRKKRLAHAFGGSIQIAQMNAAKAALDSRGGKTFFRSYYNNLMLAEGFFFLNPSLNDQKYSALSDKLLSSE